MAVPGRPSRSPACMQRGVMDVLGWVEMGNGWVEVVKGLVKDGLGWTKVPRAAACQAAAFEPCMCEGAQG
jgi:hypothetical protein